jgi:DNA-binding transcriptional ArsR family regulator
VSDLAQPFAKTMSLPAITKHLKVLEGAGLIQKTREAQWRKCSISAAPLREASGWIDQYRKHWEAALDRLGEYLKEVQKPKHKKGSTHGRKR